MNGPYGKTAHARTYSASKSDPVIWEETSRRYGCCHPGDTFADLVRRSSFSKEDRRLMEDWLASTKVKGSLDG